MTIWFDMDGTLADLYGVEGWLDMIISENPAPYRMAQPLVNLNSLARILNRLQHNGWEIGIVSWLAKNATESYNEAVTRAKLDWLKKHLNSVQFDKIDIIPYGAPKNVGRDGILFDDECGNREAWNGTAFNVDAIIETLKSL